MSDLHLGADNSLLTNVDYKNLIVDASKPSSVLQHLGKALKTLAASQAQKPTLVLNGDLLELALSQDNTAIMAFERFIETLFPPDADALVANDIIFIPGNHDHHLWETARETQYVEFLRNGSNPPGTGLPEPWHTTKMFDVDLVNAFLLTNIIKRYDRLQNVSIKTAYPDLGFISDDGKRSVLFTHGHYTESIYRLMSSARTRIFPETAMPRTIWDIEEENFAWIDFFWSTMGRSGAVGMDVERIYMMLLTPKLRGELGQRVVDALLTTVTAHHVPLADEILGPLVGKMLGGGGGLEKNQHDQALSEDGEKGLRWYVEGPLASHIASDQKKLGGSTSIVFGHTHKPFVRAISFAGFNDPVAVYNSGGWVVDSADVAATHGGSIVVVDEALNVAAIRVYNEGDYQVRADGIGGISNPLLQELSLLLKQETNVWNALSREIQNVVPQYHECFRRRLSADTTARGSSS